MSSVYFGVHMRGWGLAGVILIALGSALALPPIPQDLGLHDLADRRAWAGIPNFMDVASNLAFLLVGVAGLALRFEGAAAGAARAWKVFFAGTVLVFFGSVYYHWDPNNETLVWDRVPIMIAFMALFAALVSEHVGERLQGVLLVSSLAIGTGSVWWWTQTDDLRLYVWAQAAPMITIVYVLIAFPGRYTHRGYLGWALAAYALAKVLEFQDRAVYALTAHAMSGHSLKHLLAAAGGFFIYLMLRRRAPVAYRAEEQD